MTTRLRDTLSIGTMTIRNRLYRAPVLEGAGASDNPARVYARHFVPNARHGVGLIIQGHTTVTREGTTSPGMNSVEHAEDMLQFKPMTEAVQAEGARIVVQLGHGGTYALESWHQEFIAARTQPPLAPSRLPLPLRLVMPKVHVPTTSEVEALIDRFGQVAAWAREAGYDGVQVAASNAKLLHQFLSPTYNKRDDRFGGSFRNRARILEEVRSAIAREAGEDYPVLLKLCAEETRGLGRGRLSLRDGVRLARIAEDCGYDAITPVAADVLPNTGLCRGAFPKDSLTNDNIRKLMREAAGNRWRLAVIAAGMWLSSKQYPFERIWNQRVFTRIADAVDVPVFAVGGIRTPKEASEILRSDQADMIGIGRPFYAEPKLAERFIAESAAWDDSGTHCESCNQCVVPQMLGMPGICYNPAVNKKKKTKGQKKRSKASKEKSSVPVSAASQ